MKYRVETVKSLFDYLGDNWISIFALLISLVLLYRDYLQPFKLYVRGVGRVIISKNPWSEGLQQACIHLDLVFSNIGANRGVIEDVALELRSYKSHVILRSLATVSDRSMRLGKDLLPPELESFIGFELEKRESTMKQILFVPYTGFDTFNFKATTYGGVIWVKHSNHQKWVNVYNLEFSVDEDDLIELDKSTMTLQPDGRFYVNWITRNKVLKQTESLLQDLLKITTNKPK